MVGWEGGGGVERVGVVGWQGLTAPSVLIRHALGVAALGLPGRCFPNPNGGGGNTWGGVGRWVVLRGWEGVAEM